jgi:hypothetical protein
MGFNSGLKGLRRKQATVNWKKKHQIARCGWFALGEVMDLSQQRLQNA